jgi:hypothetical protein
MEVVKLNASRLIRLAGGLVVPIAAYALTWDLEQRGCELALDGRDVLVGPRDRITDDDRRGIRKYKADIRVILSQRNLVVM